MPRPPRIDDLDKISFVTNYFLQGCKPPYSLIVEFSQKPAKAAWLMILGVDLGDIMKAWLRPSRGRRRTPRRHGRKRPNGLRNLDVNELLGGDARRRFGPYPGIDLPGSRMLFRITDQIDNVNWSAAVLSGLTDIGFETLHGILSAHPEHCPGMAFVNAVKYIPQDIIGVAPPTLPIGWDEIESKQNFEGPVPFAMTTFQEDFSVAAEIHVRGDFDRDTVGLFFNLNQVGGAEIARSNVATLSPGQEITLTLSGEVPAGEFVYIGRTVVQGSIQIQHGSILGFAGTWL